MNLGTLIREADPLRFEGEHVGRRESMRRIVLAQAAVRHSPALALDGLLTRRGFTLLVAIATVAFTFALWPRPALQAAVRFEIHMAEDTPAPGLTPAVVGMTGRTVYIHDQAIVTNDDIETARVVPGDTPSTFGVQVEFTAEGGQKMFAATSASVGGLLAVLIDGEVVMAPIIRSPVSTVGLISGAYTHSEAEHIARGIRLR